MIGKKCKHVKTKYIGTITQELQASKTFPEQWGINWKQGYCDCFWHDKNKIVLLEKLQSLTKWENESIGIFPYCFQRLLPLSKETKINNQTKTNQMSKNNLAYQQDTQNVLNLMNKEKMSYDVLKEFLLQNNEDIILSINYWITKRYNANKETKETCDNAIQNLEGIMLQRIQLTKDVYQITPESNVAKEIETLTDVEARTPADAENIDISQRDDTEDKISKELQRSNKVKSEKTHVHYVVANIFDTGSKKMAIELKEQLVKVGHKDAGVVPVKVKDVWQFFVYSEPFQDYEKATDKLKALKSKKGYENFLIKSVALPLEKYEEVKKTKEVKEESTEIIISFAETPTWKELGTECKNLIKAGKDKAAKELATKYLSTGNYVPKKDKQKPENKTEKAINSWLVDITETIKHTDLTDLKDKRIDEIQKKNQEKDESTDIVITKTLEKEIDELNDFVSVLEGKIEEYNALKDDDDEGVDKLDAEFDKLYDDFFKDREYSEEGINKFKEHIDGGQKSNADLFEILTGEIKVTSDQTVPMLQSAIKDKIENGDDLITILNFYTKSLVGKIVEENEIQHEIYTKLHLLALLEDLYNNVQQAKTDTKENLKNLDKSSEKIIQKSEVKDVIDLLIKNGGLKEDLPDNSGLHKMLNKQISINENETTVYKTLEEMKDFVEIIYDESKKAFDNDRTEYSLQDFLNIVRQNFKNDKSEDDCFNNSISLVYPNEKKLLDLTGDNVKIHFDSPKDVREYIHSVYETEQKAIDKKEVKSVTEESKEQEIDISKEPTFNSFNEVRVEGDKLVKSGYTFAQILAWLERNILNKQLEEQATKESVFNTTDKVLVFAKGFFKDLYEKEQQTNEKEFDLDDEIIEALKEENAKISSVSNVIHKKYPEASLKEIYEKTKKLAKKHAMPIWEAFLEKQRKDIKEEENKVAVEQTIAESDPNMWEKYKDSKSLDDLYNVATKLCAKDESDKALSLYLQVIPRGNIDTAKNWNTEQITKWFDNNLLHKEIPETEKSESEEIKTTEEMNTTVDLTELEKANDKKAFKELLQSILKEHGDGNDIRKQIINTIKSGKCEGAYIKQIHKNKDSDMQNTITKIKKDIEKFS